MRVHSHPVSRGALPADTRFVPAPHLDFLAAHRIGQVGLYLGGKAFKRLPGLRVGFCAGVTEEMRETANRIRTELETTRSDLHKSVFDLPKELATAMQRSVSDQINVLKKLSDRFDVDGDQVQPARRTPVDEAQSRPMETLVETVRPIAPEPTENTPAPTEGARQGGWVRDLLRHASRDEPQPQETPATSFDSAPEGRSRDQVVASLNSQSVDIMKAIDYDASSVDLWERYRKGERNVFTRHLSALTGQRTSDAIRDKYKADGDFRTNVDRYCKDFERLLDDVERNDHDNVMTRKTYLTSDTGKVYTMLAHATGWLR